MSQERRINSEGIRNFEVTTSGWLFNPRQAFAVVNELNEKRSPDEWIKIEVYPTIAPKLLKLARRLGVPFIPEHVTAEKIRQWQKDYPRAQVSRVHLEFSFDPCETYFHRPLVGENFRPPKEAVRQRLFQLAWIFYIGPATSLRGVKLAQGLDVGVNAHPNVIVGFAKKKQLQDIRQKVPFFLVENERPYRSPHLARKGFTSQQLASDPEVIKTEIIERYHLDGLVFGADHALEYGLDPIEKLQRTKDVVRALHLASSQEQGTHGLVEINDPRIKDFLEVVSRTTFSGEVSAALDYNPLEFRKLSPTEQAEILRETFAWIASTQR